MLSGAWDASKARVRLVGIAADHGGFALKTELSVSLRASGYEIEDFGAQCFDEGVEDDDMNILCLGGMVIGSGLALELIETFPHAHFIGAARHERRLAKIHALETGTLAP